MKAIRSNSNNNKDNKHNNNNNNGYLVFVSHWLSILVLYIIEGEDAQGFHFAQNIDQWHTVENKIIHDQVAKEARNTLRV
jgi:hypothetical protein